MSAMVYPDMRQVIKQRLELVSDIFRDYYFAILT